MSIIINRNKQAAAHFAAFESSKESARIIQRTENVMLQCFQARMQCAQAKQQKQEALAEVKIKVIKLKKALQNLLKNSENTQEDLNKEGLEALPPIIIQNPNFVLGNYKYSGNTCYINAAVQALLASSRFKNSLQLIQNPENLIQALQTIANTKDAPGEYNGWPLLFFNYVI